MQVLHCLPPADSGALTSGMSMSADPRYRGATMAMHSTVGLGLSALGAWVVGVALDARVDRTTQPPGPLRFRCWRRAFCLGRWRSIGPQGRARNAGNRQLPIILALGTTQTLAWASNTVAGDPGRSDRAISGSAKLDLAAFSASLVISACSAAHRPPDRSGRRQVGAVDFQSDAGGGIGAARLHPFDPVLMLAWLLLGVGMGCGLYDAAFGASACSMARRRAAARLPASRCSRALPPPSAGR